MTAASISIPPARSGDHHRIDAIYMAGLGLYRAACFAEHATDNGITDVERLAEGLHRRSAQLRADTWERLVPGGVDHAIGLWDLADRMWRRPPRDLPELRP